MNIFRDFIFNTLEVTKNFKLPKFNFLNLTDSDPGLKGNLAFNRADNTFYGHDGIEWTSLSGGGGGCYSDFGRWNHTC